MTCSRCSSPQVEYTIGDQRRPVAFCRPCMERILREEDDDQLGAARGCLVSLGIALGFVLFVVAVRWVIS